MTESRYRLALSLFKQATRQSRSSGRRSLRPTLEDCEARTLLNGTIVPRPTLGTVQVEAARIDRLAPYWTLQGTVTRGPHAGFTLSGPLALGITDARGQVSGLLFQQGGPPLTVVGGVFGRFVSLRVNLPGGGAVQLFGTGQLLRVAGGLPDGLALAGSGRLEGPAKADAGSWFTVRPSAALHP